MQRQGQHLLSLSTLSLHYVTLYYLTSPSACQNVNSLNISTNCPKQLKKVNAILSLNTDIIFLSDTRLNTSVRGECRDLLDVFLYNQNTQYNCYFNSKGNCRGVGILVSTRLNISICNTFKDEDDNILGLLCNLDGSMILLVAIYGPNKNCNSHSFFNSLSKCLVDLPHVGCVLGGDWNATYSSEDCANNIDIHNMVAPPSIVRSRLLGDLCAQHNLSDPYRALYPERRDFTFQPRTRQNNRSRLDFFLISDCMLGSVNECSIPAEISTVLFDHKSVTLRFGKTMLNQTLGLITLFFHIRGYWTWWLR
jgi:exonuclease III